MAKKKVQKEYILLKHISVSIGYGLLFFFLIANILFSQQISLLYFELINNDSNAMTTLLKKARSASYFSLISPEIRGIFSTREDEVFAEERNRKELIQKLELLREENPKSRDILYSLHLLYEKAGNEEKARQYLLQAQEIDPLVK